MSITASCTTCGRNFFAPTQFAGKRVKCKGCGEVFTVPNPGGSEDFVESEDQTDTLAELAAITTTTPFPQNQHTAYGESDDQEVDEPDPRGSNSGVRLAPNVLTFNYPGADDVDRWLPIALVIVGFLLLLCGLNSQETSGVGWIAFTRFLVPSALYVAFTFPITLTMLRRAAAELRYSMPPNYKLRCLAAYMPAFVLMTWAQFAGEGFTIVQLIAGLLGLGLSSVLLWLFFRLRDVHIGTSVAYGAGGFVAAAAICAALLLGMNKIGALIVTDQHALASVPVSPFGAGFAWPSPPPPPPKEHVEHPVVTTAPPSTVSPLLSAPTAPAPMLNEAVSLGHFDPQTIPGVIGDLIDPLGDSSSVCVVRAKQPGVAIESWNTQTWERLPGTLQLPNRPGGNIAISNNGERLAWIAEFPRLSVQIWSFTSGTVVNSVDLDRSAGAATLIGFVGENLLLIDRPATAAAPASATPPTSSTAKPTPVQENKPAKKTNIFDDMKPDAPQPKADVIWADGTHGHSASAPPTVDSQSKTPAAGQTASAPEQATSGHQFSVVDVTTGSMVRSFFVPPLAADPGTGPVADSDAVRYGQNIAISLTAQRMAAACKIEGIPSLIQIDLATGKIAQTIKVTEIDPGLSGSPTGLAYSNDGQSLAALYENGGSALLLAYDAALGKKTSSFVYPSGPLEGSPHWLFRGSALCWLDPSPYWLVYGQGIVSTQTGAHIKSSDLNLSDSGQQRSLEGDRVELLTNTTAGKRLYILQLDRSKLSEPPSN